MDIYEKYAEKVEQLEQMTQKCMTLLGILKALKDGAISIDNIDIRQEKLKVSDD